MPIILFNVKWMSFNIALAFAGVLFALFFLRTKGFLKFLFFILWVLFLPNTIYLATDMQYFLDQFIVADFLLKIILLGQYSLVFILGIITFMVGIKPLEKVLKYQFKKDKELINIANILINFTIAFAVILGKVERVHSWYVFTDPKRVIESSIKILSSQNLIILIFLIGILINLVFFQFKKLKIFK